MFIQVIHPKNGEAWNIRFEEAAKSNGHISILATPCDQSETDIITNVSITFEKKIHFVTLWDMPAITFKSYLELLTGRNSNITIIGSLGTFHFDQQAKLLTKYKDINLTFVSRMEEVFNYVSTQSVPSPRIAPQTDYDNLNAGPFMQRIQKEFE